MARLALAFLDATGWVPTLALRRQHGWVRAIAFLESIRPVGTGAGERFGYEGSDRVAGLG